MILGAGGVWFECEQQQRRPKQESKRTKRGHFRGRSSHAGKKSIRAAVKVQLALRELEIHCNFKSDLNVGHEKGH
jgi:hypothetical protein